MADEDDETFPPETQKLPTEFAFREFGRLPLVCDQIDKSSSSNRNSLLAVANIYGLFCVGYSAGFKIYTNSSLVVAAASQLAPEALVDVPLKSPPHWLAISADNLTLVVCSSGDKGLQALFFDSRNLINKAKPTKTPFCVYPLSKSPKETVVSLHWNPSLETTYYLAICLSSGALHMLSVTDDVQELGQKSSDFGACSACWSPRGKQVMIGKRDGSMQQFTPKLEIRRTVPVYDAIEGQVKVDDVQWLSTLQVAFTYTPISDDGDWQPSLFVVSLPPAKEQNKAPSWRNYEDPCYGMTGPRPPHFMMSYLDKWGLFVIASAHASETAVVARNKTTEVWEIWNLDDSCRAQLPMDDNNEEPHPLGVAVMYTAESRIIVDDTRECNAMPVYAMLSCDGHLILFHMINLQSRDHYPELTIKAQPLTADGERATVMNKMGSLDVMKTLSDSGKPKLAIRQSLVGAPSTESHSPALSSTQLSTTPLHGDGIFGAEKTGVNKLAPRSLTFPNQSTPVVPNPPRASAASTESLFKAPPAVDSKPVMKKPLGKTFSIAPTGSESSLFPLSTPATETGIIKQHPDPTPHLKQQPVLTPNLKQQPDPVFNMKQPNPTPNVKQHLNPVSCLKQQPDNVPSLKLAPDPNPNLDSSFSSLSTAHLQINSARSSATVSTNKRRSSTTKEKEKSVNRDIPHEGSSVMDGLASEVGDFEAELGTFIAGSHDVSEVVASLGGDAEKNSLRKSVEHLSTFGRDIIKNTFEQHDEIKAVRGSTLECYAAVQNVETHRKRVENPAYRSALRARPLDLSDQRMMKELRALLQYIKDSMKETNMVLDEQWGRSMKQRRSSSLIHKSERRAKIEEKETIRQALFNQTQILHNQEMTILLLGQELDKLRLLNTTWQSPFMDQSLPEKAEKTDPASDSSDLPTLASSLIRRSKDESLVGSGRGPQSARISPKKALQLSEFLASRKNSPIRSSYAIRRSKFIAPSFTRARRTSDASREESGSRFSSTIKSEYSAGSEYTSSEAEKLAESMSKEDSSGYRFTRVDDSTITDEKTPSSVPLSDTSYRPPSSFAPSSFPPSSLPSSSLPSSSLPLSSFPSSSLPPYSQPALPPPSESPQESSLPVPIEGTSTFTYGGRDSSPHAQPIKKFDPTATQAEAASNLNNPPKVVNIKELSNPQVVNPLKAPVTFHPEPSVSPAVANEVQKVLNTVRAEHPPTGAPPPFPVSAGAPHSIPADTAAASAPGPGFRSTSFSFSTGSGSGAPFSSSFSMKLPSSQPAPAFESADNLMRRSASDRSLFTSPHGMPKSSSLASLPQQRPPPEKKDVHDAPPEGAPPNASVVPASDPSMAPPAGMPSTSHKKVDSTDSASVSSKPGEDPVPVVVHSRGSSFNLTTSQAAVTGEEEATKSGIG